MNRVARFFDTVVSTVSPAAGLRRERARLTAHLLNQQFGTRRYEAATKKRRGEGWQAKGTSAQTEVALDLHTLRDRSRDLVRNNPNAARAVTLLQNNVVGSGIRASIANPKAAAAWKQWAETTDCDARGRMDFYGIQELVIRTVAESGECLVIRRRASNTASGIPLRLLVLEGDYLDTAKTTPLDTGYIQNGVELDRDGRPVAYWLYDRHPGDQQGPSFVSKRYPASEVLHIFDMLRPGQVRGVPFGASAMLRMYDLDGFEDAQLIRQKIAACYAVFVTDSAEALGGFDSDRRGEAEKVEPGIIEYLPPGKAVTFASPPGAEGAYVDYVREHLRRIAASYGVTYEALTGDYSQVNYSSARMGAVEMNRNMLRLQTRMMVPQLCQPVFSWFAEASQIVGRGRAALTANWSTPRQEMVDPTREVPAIINMVRGHLMSQSEALRKMGYEPDEVFAEIAADNERLDQLGLISDSDPRKVMKAGITQPYLDTPSTAAGFTDPEPEPAPAPAAPA